MTTIADYAFFNSGIVVDSEYHKLNIPDTVRNLGKYAFSVRASEIYFSKNIKVIHESAVITNVVKKMTLPKNLEVIDDWGLRTSGQIKTLTIPSKVRSIGKGNFYGNGKVIIKSKKLKKIGTFSFETSYAVKYGKKVNKRTIIVPKSKVNEYAKMLKKSMSVNAKKKIKFIVKGK